MKLSVVIMLCVMPFSLLAIKKAKEPARAPRPDALSYFGSTPEIVSPFDTAQLAQIQECICSLKNITESGFDVIESLLDALSSCGPISITESGDITLSTPGYYCLVNDVGNITITSSFVVLNMSERIAESLTISGVASGGISHIIVTNGFIYNVPQVPGTSVTIDYANDVTLSNMQIDSDNFAAANRGIYIANSDEVAIEDVGINRVSSGIYVDYGANNLYIERTSIFVCQDAGITVTFAAPFLSFISIKDTVIGESDNYGLYAYGVSCDIFVSDTKFLNCRGIGLNFEAGNIIINNVEVDLCTSGFYFTNSANAQLSGCTVSNYSINGFNGESARMWCSSCVANAAGGGGGQYGFSMFFGEFILEDCSSSGNAVGFYLKASQGTCLGCKGFFNTSHGFQVLHGSIATLTGCDSYSNGLLGFMNVDINTNATLVNCSAFLNGDTGIYMADSASVTAYACQSFKNGSAGFEKQGFDTVVIVELCAARSNGFYGFYDSKVQGKDKNVTYYSNKAIGNLPEDYNADQGKWPFYYKLAKDTSLNIMDNILAELIIGAVA